MESPPSRKYLPVYLAYLQPNHHLTLLPLPSPLPYSYRNGVPPQSQISTRLLRIHSASFVVGRDPPVFILPVRLGGRYDDVAVEVGQRNYINLHNELTQLTYTNNLSFL